MSALLFFCCGVLACLLLPPAVGRGEEERSAAVASAIEKCWQASQLPPEIYGRCELQFTARHVQGDRSETMAGTVTVRDDRVLWRFERTQTAGTSSTTTHNQVLLSKSYVAQVTSSDGSAEPVQSRVVVTRPGAGDGQVDMLLRFALPRSWAGFRGEPILPWSDAAGTPLPDAPLHLSRVRFTSENDPVFEFVEQRSSIWVLVEASRTQGNHVVRSTLGFADPQEQRGLPGDVAELHWRQNDAGTWYCDSFRLKLVDAAGNIWEPQTPDWPHPYGEFEVTTASFRGGLDVPIDELQLKSLTLSPGSTVSLEAADASVAPQEFATDAAGKIPDALISQAYRLASTLKTRPVRRRAVDVGGSTGR